MLEKVLKVAEKHELLSSSSIDYANVEQRCEMAKQSAAVIRALVEVDSKLNDCLKALDANLDNPRDGKARENAAKAAKAFDEARDKLQALNDGLEV